jgi:PAS domain S-box-containing protein
MNMDKFDQKVGALSRRVAELGQRNSDNRQQQVLTEVFKELHSALAELEIVAQELRQQNEELSLAKAAVEAERQRYQELFEFAPDGYLVTDAQGMIQEANRAAAKLLNVKQEFLVGKPLIVFIADSERQVFRANLNELQQIDWISLLEVSLQPRKGVSFKAALTVAAIRNGEGKLIALRWLLRDVTDRKGAELALQQLNANLERQVQERTSQLQQALDFEAMLKRITDKVRDSLDESQILQTAVEELALILHLSGCNAALYNLSQGTSTICYEYTTELPTSQGRVAYMASCPEIYYQLLQGQYFQFCSIVPNPVRGQVAMLACPVVDDQGVLGDLWLINQKNYAFNDLEIRFVQQVANQCAIAIRQARLTRTATAQVQELEKLNRLKDDFLSTVSHELRTPVSNMKMAIQMLQIASLPKQQERYIKVLQAECDREVELINNLLDLQQLEAMSYSSELEIISLKDWLPGIIKPFQLRTQERQQILHVELPPSVSELFSDRVSLGRVLTELLNNAYKYTPASGEIVLKVGVREEDSSSPDPHSPIPNSSVIFTISNSAEIPAAELPHIFKKFYRVPNANPWQQSGTGLGLALVQKLVEHMQGTIKVESFREWTTFTVQLPNQPKS